MGNTYSFLDTTCSITGPGGSFNLSGQGAGNSKEGIDYEYIDDKNTLVTGADGSPMNSLNASTASRVTARFLKTSPVNSMLSSLYNTQAASSSLWGQNVITLKNAVSGDSITFTNVAFRKQPKNGYAVEANMIEWEFDAGITAVSLGGGGTVASAAALVQASV